MPTMDNNKLTKEMTTKVFEMTLREGDKAVTFEVTVTYSVVRDNERESEAYSL